MVNADKNNLNTYEGGGRVLTSEKITFNGNKNGYVWVKKKSSDSGKLGKFRNIKNN